MIRAKISAPKGTITGTFSVSFHLSHKIYLSDEDILIETIDGHPLGSERDSLNGDGFNYTKQFYFDDPAEGVSRISIGKEGVGSESVVVEYDIDSILSVEFGTPLKKNNKVVIPVSMSSDAVLTKRVISITPNVKYKLFGAGSEYQIRIDPSVFKEIQVCLCGAIQKYNGKTTDLTTAMINISL